MVGQRHVTRHRHVAPANQPGIRDGMIQRAKRSSGDPRRAVAGEACGAVDTLVSMASARLITGRMVVSRRASIDLLTSGGR
jgi:hypothetical protein